MSNKNPFGGSRSGFRPEPSPNGGWESSASQPSLQQRSDSFLPPHQRESITKIPVTPGVALGTCNNHQSTSNGITTGYFSRRRHGSSRSPGHFEEESNQPPSDLSNLESNQTVNPEINGDAKLSGNLISATFTIPHSLQYRKGRDWELRHGYWESAHLDSLAYLSSKESPWNHTVIAWTGEIHHSEADQDTSSDDIYITHADQSRLENQLYHHELRTIPVWLAEDSDFTNDGIQLKDQSRWRRYAEHDLCALFHYRQHPPTNERKEDARWADFLRMNEAFADKICEIYKPGDIVMVHDHYLMLLPSILRKRRPNVYVSFFLHAPFPTSELVRCLAKRKEILQGVLGANLIAFQAFHYAQHFATSCARILGHLASTDAVDTPGGRVHVGVFPVGVNVSKINSLAWTEAANEKCAMLRKSHRGKKIIIGCDPLDSLGGVDKKMMAFERFLFRYPEWQEKVVLLQISSPTTIEDDDGEEARYASRVNELVSSVNAAYGSLSYVPVQNYSQHLTGGEYFALLRTGDVALITSVRDGMSTTGLEYIVCQRDSYGPLIISEFSGTASSLEDAIQINPWDLNKVADEINKALTMSEERRRSMHEAIYERVTNMNVASWVNNILGRFVDVVGTHISMKSTSIGVPSLPLEAPL